jgi:DNA-binding LacI/PurR family transcriptional regulator
MTKLYDGKKKPTIKDIAKILNVSHVAVSRALRDANDISDSLKERVRLIADEIGYIPNASARSLSSKNSNHNIGMIVPSIGAETAYNEAFQAISAQALEKGHSVFLGVSNRDKELEKIYCRNMCENRVGALIIAPVSSEIGRIKDVCKDLLPVIFIGGKVEFNEPNCVKFNYKHSAEIAVNYLYNLGHKKIALFLYNPENNTILQKKEGYIEAMNKLKLDPKVYIEGHSSDTYEAGYKLVENIIKEDNLPTAIWCASDLMAMGVIDSLKKHNISIPKDISVMGHDNLYFSKFKPYNLTTFNIPKKEMGEAAVNIALSLMGDIKKSVQTKVEFTADLVERKSTGPLITYDYR